MFRTLKQFFTYVLVSVVLLSIFSLEYAPRVFAAPWNGNLTVSVSPTGKIKSGQSISINISNGPTESISTACVYVTNDGAKSYPERCDDWSSSTGTAVDLKNGAGVIPLYAPDVDTETLYQFGVAVQVPDGTGKTTISNGVAFFSLTFVPNVNPVVQFSKTSVKSNEQFTAKLTGGPKGKEFCIVLAPGSACISDTGLIDSNGSSLVNLQIETIGDASLQGAIKDTSAGVTTKVGSPQTIVVTSAGSSGGTDYESRCPRAFVDTDPIELKINSTNTACITVAQELMGYSPANGSFDAKFDAFVRKYQKDSGFDSACIDGIIGPQTWGSLTGVVYKVTKETGCYKNQNGNNGNNNGNNNGGINSGKTGAPECNNDPGLQYVNGLCLPLGRPTGNGLISCSSIGDCVSRLIKILLTLGGIIAVIFIIIGGYQYMTSAGNEESAGKGKKTLLYAIIGLAVILLAYTIVTVVFNSLTKDSILGQAGPEITVQKSV